MSRMLLLPLALALVGCTPRVDEGADLGPLPAECRLDPDQAQASHPPGPYGFEVGEVIRALELQDCDGHTVRLAQLLADAEMVLLNVGSGWCQPCIDETAVLEAEVFRPLCQRGLKIVQVLVEDQDGRPATKLFCQQWRDRFELSFPVLVDPLFTLEDLFEELQAQNPINLLLDPDGRIRWRVAGTVPGDLRGEIEAQLEN